MATNFPTSLQDLDATRGTAGQTLGAPSHVTHHTTEDDTLEAVQTKVGIDGSAVTTTHDYKLSGVTGSDKGVSLTGTETLTNKTLTAPVLNGSMTGTGILDEDNMVSDSITSLATQQSIKAYVDAQSTVLINDITPQLGADLDANAFDIQFDDATGIRDDSDNEQLIFQKTTTAVNHFEMTNAATGNFPTLSSVGGDTNVDMILLPKGTGVLSVSGTTTYEANVTADDDVPNKKYVDDLKILYYGAVASDTLKASSDAEVDQGATTAAYVKVKEVQMRVPGTVRVKFDHKYTAGATANARIYINGVAQGTERTGTGSYVTYSEDFSVEINDLVQLYLKHSASSNDSLARNFRTYYDMGSVDSFNVIT